MAKKAELEQNWRAHHLLIEKAKSEWREKRHDTALDYADSSLEHLEGAMQYGKRFAETEFTRVPAIDFIANYAPLRLRHKSLDRAELLLKERRGIQRRTPADLTSILSKAKSNLLLAHSLWTMLDGGASRGSESQPPAARNADRSLNSILSAWHEMGIVEPSTDAPLGFKLATRMDAVVMAKCSSCGVTGRGRKEKFLEGIICPKCNTLSTFVLLVRPI